MFGSHTHPACTCPGGAIQCDVQRREHLNPVDERLEHACEGGIAFATQVADLDVRLLIPEPGVPRVVGNGFNLHR
eukprot:4918361-Prymnesium_polylepis.1